MENEVRTTFYKLSTNTTTSIGFIITVLFPTRKTIECKYKQIDLQSTARYTIYI